MARWGLGFGRVELAGFAFVGFGFGDAVELAEVKGGVPEGDCETRFVEAAVDVTLTCFGDGALAQRECFGEVEGFGVAVGEPIQASAE